MTPVNTRCELLRSAVSSFTRRVVPGCFRVRTDMGTRVAVPIPGYVYGYGHCVGPSGVRLLGLLRKTMTTRPPATAAGACAPRWPASWCSSALCRLLFGPVLAGLTVLCRDRQLLDIWSRLVVCSFYVSGDGVVAMSVDAQKVETRRSRDGTRMGPRGVRRRVSRLVGPVSARALRSRGWRGYGSW